MLRGGCRQVLRRCRFAHKGPRHCDDPGRLCGAAQHGLLRARVCRREPPGSREPRSVQLQHCPRAGLQPSASEQRAAGFLHTFQTLTGTYYLPLCTFRHCGWMVLGLGSWSQVLHPSRRSSCQNTEPSERVWCQPLIIDPLSSTSSRASSTVPWLGAPLVSLASLEPDDRSPELCPLECSSARSSTVSLASL